MDGRILRDVAAGLFCALVGAGLALAWAYRDQIRLFLKLEKDGTIAEVSALGDEAKKLYSNITALRPRPKV